MNDEELIHELTQDREDNQAVDNACLLRLRLLAKDYGKEGEVADRLLDIVEKLLDM